MNNHFSFRRIGLLLRYDLAQSRRTLLMTAGIIVGIYILSVYDKFIPPVYPQAPEDIALTCHGVFSMAFYVAIVVATLMLQRKFTNPTSAPLYLTLPASPLEKFVTLLLDYAAVMLGVRVLEFVCFTLSMALIATQVETSISFWSMGLNWEYQIINELYSYSSNYEKACPQWANIGSHVCGWSMWLASLLYFVCLNFHFKRNGIMKSCLMMVLTYFVLFCIVVPVISILYLTYIEHTYGCAQYEFEQNILPTLDTALNALGVLMWLSPVVPVLVGWRLYWLVAHRQVK